MGQTESGDLAPVEGQGQGQPVVPPWLQAKVQKQAGEIKQMVSLSYESFCQSIGELNEITLSFCDVSGKQLHFQVKKGTDSTILWKGTVRIRCHKVNCRTGAIESTRLLNLRQYIHLYNEIRRQASMATLQTGEGSSGFCASFIITQLEGQSEADNDAEECCICMDRKAEIILACAHMYCEQCIDEWNVNHKTCPICRAKVDNSDDTWVLTEKPDQNEMAYETTGYLMGLADRTGTPSHSPTD